MLTSTSKRVVYADLPEVEAGQKEEVRVLRNDPEIRRYMYTDHEISPAEHSAWIASLNGSKDRRVWAIVLEGACVGVVALSKIDGKHSTAEWGFYLDPARQGTGIGAIVEFDLLEYVFGELGLEKLCCEVLETNPAVVNMHLKFGFLEEGRLKSQIRKGEDRLDVHRLGILRDEWTQSRTKLQRTITRLA